MAKRRGWAGQLAPLARAGDVVGTLLPDLAAQTGLSPEVRIHAGLHDSNAALNAARGFAEIADCEATVLSTGTWFVAMRSAQSPIDLAALPEARDCLVNVDVQGQPVPSSRWMGGRELELLGVRIDQPGTAGLDQALAAGAMLLPSQVADCGPFPGAKPCWISEPSDPTQRAAAIALYAALMADTQLDLIGAKGTLLIEGRFAAAELFTRALASLRPDTAVYIADGGSDVSYGALRLIDPHLRPRSTLHRAEPLTASLETYRAAWRDQTDHTGR